MTRMLVHSLSLALMGILVLTATVLPQQETRPATVASDATAKPAQPSSGHDEPANVPSPVPGNGSPAGTGGLNPVLVPSRQLGIPLPTGADQPRYIASSRIAVTWSEKNDAVWGFSVTRGTWTKQEVTPPAPVPLQPMVGDSVAALRVGSTVYAYSADTGRWDVLNLPETQTPQVMVDSDLVVILAGPDVYTFANALGRWTSPQGIPGREGDALNPATAESAATFPPVAHLLTQYKQKDQRAQQIAADYLKLRGIAKPDSAKLDTLQSELRSAVTDAFAARQLLHQAELADFRQRMARIEETIERRNIVRDEIIDRRVSDLLDPDRKWETGPAIPRGDDPLVAPRMPGSWPAESPAVSDSQKIPPATQAPAATPQSRR